MRSKKTIKKAKRKPSIRYDPVRVPKIVFALYVVGKNDSEIAYLLDISPSTFHEWRDRYPEIQQAFRDSHQEGATLEVENALLKAALGWDSTQESVRSKVEITPGTGEKKLVPVSASKVQMKMQPSVKAAELWLTNKKPDAWKKRQSIDVTPMPMGKPSNVHFYLPENGRPTNFDDDDLKAIEGDECQKQIPSSNI